jgi:N-acetylglucosamine transport system permease protein
MKRKLFDRITGKVITTIIYIFLGFWSLIVIFPMLWVIYSSFKTDKEIFFSPWQPPTKLILDNFVRAFSKAMIGQYFLNSLIVIIPAIFFTLLLSAMTGYVLARFKFPGNRIIFYAFLGGMIFPVALALVPLFFLLQSFKILDSHFGLILVYIS